MTKASGIEKPANNLEVMEDNSDDVDPEILLTNIVQTCTLFGLAESKIGSKTLRVFPVSTISSTTNTFLPVIVDGNLSFETWTVPLEDVPSYEFAFRNSII